MKRTDIRAGVVYAVKASYSRPSPVVFLEDSAAGLYQRGSRGDSGFTQVTESAYTKAKRGTGWNGVTYGYAAVVPADRYVNDALSVLRGIEATAEIERFRTTGKPSSGHLRFDLITSLTRIAPWDEAIAEYEAAEAADRKRREDADARRRRASKALKAFRERCGITGEFDCGGAVITFDIEDAERLLALLAEKAGG